MSVKRAAFGAAVAAGLLAVAGSARASSTYAGNGATGFGGALGNGNLVISSSGANVTFTLNNAGGFNGNDVVVYIDSVAGGVSNTSTFTDNQDGGRQAISANNNGNPSRVNISFPAGFGADYALEFENDTYDGLFNLSSPSNFGYVGGNGPSQMGGPYTVTVPLSSIGLTSGQGFKFVGDLISTSGYGSNETLGTAVVSDGTTVGNNAGFNGSIAFSAANVFPSPVPEPASVGVIALAIAGLTRRSRRA